MTMSDFGYICAGFIGAYAAIQSIRFVLQVRKVLAEFDKVSSKASNANWYAETLKIRLNNLVDSVDEIKRNMEKKK